jgi:hypothetical protein
MWMSDDGRGGCRIIGRKAFRELYEIFDTQINADYLKF